MQDLSLYDYELPEDRIAQTPLEPRDAAKLLWLSRKTGEIRHKRFSDLPDLLEEGDLLVLNDTRVTALRLKGRRETGGGVELLLLRPLEGAKYVALCKPAKRLRAGTEIELSETLTATVLDDGGQGLKTLQLRCSNNLEEELSRVGRVPLPPYIHSSLPDAERYQTVFARSPGSSAAPTAALHFTSQLLDRLRCKGVHTAFVSLDIGLDTFRPIQSEQVEDHLMHGELCRLPEETAAAILGCRGRIVAVGTTAVRTLESFAVGPRQVDSGEKETRLFIRPPYNFQIVDGMITNFHLPRTSMLLMVAAFASRERLMRAYAEALCTDYRFLSFGDAMLAL